MQPPFDRTLAGLLLEQERQAPDRVLLVHEDREITVAEVACAARAEAAALRARGIGQSDPVLTMLEPGPAHVAVVLGVALVGALWVPLAPDARGPSLAHALSVAKPGLALVAPAATGALRDAGYPADRPLEERDGWAWPPAAVPGTATTDTAPGEPDAHRAILFTSGTSGPPKGVIVTERMLVASAAGCAHASDCTPGDSYLMWEPMHHIGGPQLLAMALAGQVRLVLVKRFSASRFWDDVRRHRVTKMHYLGGILEILLKRAVSPGDRDHPVALAFGGGARPDVQRAFEDRFAIPLREVYGMTEASSFTTVNVDGIEDSVGQTVPWLEVEICDGSDRPVDPGGTGEIVVRAAYAGLLTPGYLGNAEATAELLRDGRLFTGDLGRQDAAGNLYFAGRKTDSLRRRGENVSAWEVETALASHPDIAETAVVGVESEVGEHDILCFVLVRDGVAYDPRALAEWSRKTLSRRHVPRYWKRVAGFERTPSQRIRKAALDRDLSDAFDLGDR
ncbi:AMP-binding protein [Psychromarinibacter sp. C21-152]|uniref:AMP-binding protein n=1 Tax=Psychromarinibacter sediminicola TaxID=3033385 RepID=A0AAE3T7H1_9RHOB|nr:AMP-binding protein [Psychromarinibacter sediminicola]MDF0599678.1 AMP-binding protein [Psychromarinibacter sediminicola]